MQGLIAVQVFLACLVGSCVISIGLATRTTDLKDINVGLLRSYFGCRPCDRSRCADTAHCEVVVKEAGFCGCCMSCAQLEGDRCGPMFNRCAPGLKCAPPVGGSAAKSGFQMLMEARCMPEQLDPMYEDLWDSDFVL